MNETEFAKKYPIGAPVNYHPVIGQPEFRAVSIRSLPWMLGSGHMVVKVTGIAGGVSCAAIEEVEHPLQSDRACCPHCGTTVRVSNDLLLYWDPCGTPCR